MDLSILFEGLGVSVVGILVVFLGLIVLIFFINMMSYSFKSKNNKESIKPKDEKPIEAENIGAIVEDASVINPEIIAAITAAISMFMSPSSKFFVRKIKRTNKLI